MPFDLLNMDDCYCRPGNESFTKSYGEEVGLYLAGLQARKCELDGCAASSYGLCPADCTTNPRTIPGKGAARYFAEAALLQNG